MKLYYSILGLGLIAMILGGYLMATTGKGGAPSGAMPRPTPALLFWSLCFLCFIILLGVIYVGKSL